MIINVYNPHKENITTSLMQHLQQNLDPSHYHAIIIAGDFNLHHPLWNPPRYHRHDAEADVLIEGILQQGMQLLIPPGTITYPKAGTAIDLVWGNEQAANNIMKCRVAENNDHGSDHYPIETILNLHPNTRLTKEPPYNFAKTDWKTLKTKLQEYLPTLPENNPLTTTNEIDEFATDLTNAISKAIEETTPRKKPSPFSKRWWNKELTKLRDKVNYLCNVHKRTHSAADWRKWKKKRK